MNVKGESKVMTQRHASTIEEYLKGCDCSSIYFASGGCILSLGLKTYLIYPNRADIVIPNSYLIVRHHDETRIIELEIHSIDDKQILYMTNPTATHIRRLN